MWHHIWDFRFLTFVLGTMISSVFVGGLAAGLLGWLWTGDLQLLFVVPVLSAMGAGFLVPLAFVLWILPSALIFGLCMVFMDQKIGTLRAAQYSGTTTTAVAALVATLVGTRFGSDLDSAGSIMFFVGPAALALSPWVARRLYSPDQI